MGWPKASPPGPSGHFGQKGTDASRPSGGRAERAPIAVERSSAAARGSKSSGSSQTRPNRPGAFGTRQGPRGPPRPPQNCCWAPKELVRRTRGHPDRRRSFRALAGPSPPSGGTCYLLQKSQQFPQERPIPAGSPGEVKHTSPAWEAWKMALVERTRKQTRGGGWKTAKRAGKHLSSAPVLTGRLAQQGMGSRPLAASSRQLSLPASTHHASVPSDRMVLDKVSVAHSRALVSNRCNIRRTQKLRCGFQGRNVQAAAAAVPCCRRLAAPVRATPAARASAVATSGGPGSCVHAPRACA